MIRPSVLDGGEAQRLILPRQPHRPRHLASKAHRVFFSWILLRRRCRNLRQTNGAATSTSSVSRRFTTRQLMLSLLSPEKAKGPGSSPPLPGPSRPVLYPLPISHKPH